MILTLIAAIVAGPGTPILVLKGNDPIELLKGKEVIGVESFSAQFGMHVYRFSSESNLKTFRNAPLKFAVQNGGACGKMGALTGKGSPDRWAVAEGKIFLFASDGCRETFLKNKAAYFQPLPVMQKPTKAQQKQATQLFRRMLLAHGGDPVAKVKSVEWLIETPYSEGGQNKIWKEKFAYFGPNQYAMWSEWDQGITFSLVDAKRSVEGKPNADFQMHPDEKRELFAQIVRHPAVILQSNQNDVQYVDETGNGFWIKRDGVAFKVSLNDESKQIESVSFTDRYAGPICRVEQLYSDYEEFDSVWLPKTVRVRVNGGDLSEPVRIRTFKLNGQLPKLFEIH